jgi:hypothetical protein
MGERAFPYCIPDRRELTPEESGLLHFLFAHLNSIGTPVDALKVVARCGCGACPTILLGTSTEDEPITSKHSSVVGEWQGRAADGRLVGILLFAKDGVPTELEACSIEGKDVQSWPPLDGIKPMRRVGALRVPHNNRLERSRDK